MAYIPPGARGARGQITRNIARKEKRQMMAEMQKKVAQPKDGMKAKRGLYYIFDRHDVANRKQLYHEIRKSTVSEKVKQALISGTEVYLEYNKKHNAKLKREVITKENLEELFKKLADNPLDITTREHVKTLERNFGKPDNVVDFQAAKKKIQKPVEAKKPISIASFRERHAKPQESASTDTGADQQLAA